MFYAKCTENKRYSEPGWTKVKEIEINEVQPQKLEYSHMVHGHQELTTVVEY